MCFIGAKTNLYATPVLFILTLDLLVSRRGCLELDRPVNKLCRVLF